MMTASMLMGILVLARINCIKNEYNVVRGASSRAYYAQVVISIEDYQDEDFDEDLKYAEVAKNIRQMPAVVGVAQCRFLSGFEYIDKGSENIVLYDPELFDILPGLRDTGIDFTQDPDGCVLVGDYYNDTTGDTLELTRKKYADGPVKEKELFHINARVLNPEKYIAFPGAVRPSRRGICSAIQEP